MNTLDEPKTVLIVEDESALLDALVDKFTREGFVVLGAKNGQVGLSLALANHPDMILLDLIMPVMDGMTMLSNLRKDQWGKDAKVIILSNLSEVEKTASLPEGVYDYLVKSDSDIDNVVKKVREGIGTKRGE